MLDPAKLAVVALLHWEGDENGGMDRFLKAAPGATLVGSALSIQLQRALLRLHRSCARISGRRDARPRPPPPALPGNAARAPLGLDDGRRRDHQEPVPLRPLPATWRSGADRHRKPLGRDVRGLPEGWHLRARVAGPAASSIGSHVSISSGSTRCTVARCVARTLTPYMKALREKEFAYRGFLLGRDERN